MSIGVVAGVVGAVGTTVAAVNSLTSSNNPGGTSSQSGTLPLPAGGTLQYANPPTQVPTPVGASTAPIDTTTQASQTANEGNLGAYQSIVSYIMGNLTDAAQAAYQKTITDQLQAVQAQLGAQGFDQNSTQYTNAMQNYNSWAASLKNQYLTNELNSGLAMAGMGTNEINSVNQALQTASNIIQGNNTATLNATNANNAAGIATSNANNSAIIGGANANVDISRLSNQIAGQQGQALGNLTSGLSSGLKSVGGLFDSNAPAQQSYDSNGNLIPTSAITPDSSNSTNPDYYAGQTLGGSS